jgi:methionyl-tRNA formyltransferase
VQGTPRIAFAGDRQLAVDVLAFLKGQSVLPVALLVPAPEKGSHALVLQEMCAHLSPELMFTGKEFTSPSALTLLGELELDYLISIHFPLLVPPAVLELPKYGCLNLHPAYLPFNRGWHTPSWAILDGTPIGATLHFMDDGVDTGDIVMQRQVEVGPEDTAATLYPRLLAAELEVFRAAWPLIARGDVPRQKQPDTGTNHSARDLRQPEVQRLDLVAEEPIGRTLTRLRGLTTSRLDEAAYFEADGQKYRVQVHIEPESG